MPFVKSRSIISWNNDCWKPRMWFLMHSIGKNSEQIDFEYKRAITSNIAGVSFAVEAIDI